MSTRVRVIAASLLGLIALAVAPALSTPAAAEDAAPARRPDVWPDGAREALARVAVQAEGRVKPLSTWAGYTLLRMSHQRTVAAPDGTTRDAMDWLLDAWLRPGACRTYPALLVPDGAILDAVGLSAVRRKKRDRYALAELLPARERLSRLAHQYAGIDSKRRTPVEAGVVKLAHDVSELEWLVAFLDFARARIDVSDPGLEPWFGAARRASFTEALREAPALSALAQGSDPAAMAAARVLQQVMEAGARARALACLPPLGDAAGSGRWLSPAAVAQAAVSGVPVADAHLEALAAFERVAASADQSGPLADAASALARQLRALSASSVDHDKLALEVSLNELDPFFKSQWLYVLAFVLMAIVWIKPHRWLVIAVWVLTGATLALHVYGISMRCVLRGRPPVSTLYETVLFISAFAVLASLVVERVNRGRIALSLAPFLGAVGLFIAGRYEVLKGEDTMPQLVAVLDTNFWLATHVTCITIGYAAGLLAAAFGHVYVLGQVFGLRQDDAAFYRSIGRMVYGMIAFALIFGVVGTILGGIWANESWGRFWGWDPKENGALLIVLTELMILHGRMGGFLKTYGIAMASIFLGCVVAFSWWGVNLLGIGLHSYGFTDGVMNGLRVFYAFEGAVLMTGGAWWFQARRRPA